MLFCPFSEMNRLPEAPNDLYTKITKSEFSSLVFTGSSSVSSAEPLQWQDQKSTSQPKLLQCRHCVDLLPSLFFPPLWLPTDLGGSAALAAGRSFLACWSSPLPRAGSCRQCIQKRQLCSSALDVHGLRLGVLGLGCRLAVPRQSACPEFTARATVVLPA